MGTSLSEFFPERTPTLVDLVVVVAVVVALGFLTPRMLDPAATSRPAVALGAAGTVAAIGLGNRSRRIGRIERHLGDAPLTVRLGLVMFGLVLVLLAAPNLPGREAVHLGLAIGIIVGGLAYWLAWIVVVREVEGVWNSRDTAR